MIEQERFAQKIREAGEAVQKAEVHAARMEATEKRTFAQLQVRAEAEGHKTSAAQTRFADYDDGMYDARINRGVAKAAISAAKTELLAAEVEFKTWQTQMATMRQEKRVYGS